jgi:copper oxidase (laccase) domain-containing protein
MQITNPERPMLQTVPDGALRLYGRKGPLLKKLAQAEDIAENIGGKRIQSFIPPVTLKDPGRHIIITSFTGKVENAEGCVLTESGDVTFTTTRDCHTVALSYKGKLGLAHVGRDSMLPQCSRSVLHELMRALKVEDGSYVNAFISGGISSTHFTHHNLAPLQPLIELYGSDIIDKTSGALDMVQLIRNCLNNFGVEQSRILHDGNCTYKDEWLGSRRAGKEGSNWTFLIKK